MAFKMTGWSPFTQKDPEYKNPARFTGPGSYIKHTVKVGLSKLRRLFKPKKNSKSALTKKSPMRIYNKPKKFK